MKDSVEQVDDNSVRTAYNTVVKIVKEMQKTLGSMLLTGCSKAADLMERQRDQEMRLRDIEKWQNSQRGAMLAISSVVSAAVTIAGMILTWIISK
jgi:glutaminase